MFLSNFSDFRKLAKDFPPINADKLIAQCKDLGDWYNKVGNSSGKWSMERLVSHIVSQCTETFALNTLLVYFVLVQITRQQR